jgi:hypothetical protein
MARKGQEFMEEALVAQLKWAEKKRGEPFPSRAGAAAGEEEHIDAALAGAVEQLAGAVGEEGVGAAAQQRDVGPPATALARQQRRSCRDGRGDANRHVADVANEPADHVGE